jgi:beta-lactamase class A
MRRLGEGRAVSARADALVSGWLSLDTDLSMVASAFDLDPLAHADPSAPLRLMNKTGTDVGIRADCGLVCTEAHAISYAVLANWDDDEVAVTGAVLAAMREIGTALRRLA